MVKIPPYFDGKKFMAKYQLTNDDFVDRKGFLDVPLLPDLTEKDLEDCVTPPEEVKKEITLDHFLEAFVEYQKGDPQKMEELLQKYEQSKDETIEIPVDPIEPIDPLDEEIK